MQVMADVATRPRILSPADSRAKGQLSGGGGRSSMVRKGRSSALMQYSHGTKPVVNVHRLDVRVGGPSEQAIRARTPMRRGRCFRGSARTWRGGTDRARSARQVARRDRAAESLFGPSTTAALMGARLGLRSGVVERGLGGVVARLTN